MKEIASLNNAVVKAVCELKQKKYRERENCFVVEGLRAVEEAVSYAFVQKILPWQIKATRDCNSF